MANTNPNNRTNPITNILNYPLDVVQDGHHILLTIFETEGVNYQSPYTDVNIASNQINSVSNSISSVYTTKKNEARTFAGQGKAKKKNFKAAINLYTPQQIKVQHKMNYEAEDLSFLGAGAAGVMEAMRAQGIGGTFKESIKSAQAAGQRFISGLGQFAGTGGAQQAIFGSAVNRNLAEVIFTGLEYRTFSLEYSFMPKSKREARMVDEIIKDDSE